MHAYNLGDRIVDRESAAPWHPHDQESLPVISRHRNARLMSEEALNAATARLERALGRIERAVGARESAGSGVAEAYARLEERHEMLRARVQETVGRLDVLIGHEGQR